MILHSHVTLQTHVWIDGHDVHDDPVTLLFFFIDVRTLRLLQQSTEEFLGLFERELNLVLEIVPLLEPRKDEVHALRACKVLMSARRQHDVMANPENARQ